MKSRVKWSKINQIQRLLNESSLMVGEEKQLKDDEVESFNLALRDILIHAELIHEIATEAKYRFLNRS